MSSLLELLSSFSLMPSSRTTLADGANASLPIFNFFMSKSLGKWMTSLLHNLKALSPIDLILFERYTSFNDLQELNAPFPMLVTAGKLMLVRAVHLSNALSPMLVAAGKLMLVRDVQL